MKTPELFQKGVVFSFEVFPPKRTAPPASIYETVDRLALLAPDFISVTYGAGGSANHQETLRIASAIQNGHGITSVAHLPGLYLKEEEAIAFTQALKEQGIQNILALRGDVQPGETPNGRFHYASELISFLKKHSDMNLIGACYPEGHLEAATPEADILNLKKKVNAGASHLISQLFFSNAYFYSFLERARGAGISVPIEAGIMPVINKKQIERMVSLCGATLPEKFLKIMAKYEHSPEAMFDAGIAYAVDQIVDLIARGVDGIHLYTMNNPLVAERIYQSVSSLLAR